MGMIIDWRVQIDYTGSGNELEDAVDKFLDGIYEYEERFEPLSNFCFYTETYSAYYMIPDFFQELSKRDDVVVVDLYFKSETDEASTRKTFINGNVVNYHTIISYEPIT